MVFSVMGLSSKITTKKYSLVLVTWNALADLVRAISVD